MATFVYFALHNTGPLVCVHSFLQIQIACFSDTVPLAKLRLYPLSVFIFTHGACDVVSEMKMCFFFVFLKAMPQNSTYIG